MAAWEETLPYEDYPIAVRLLARAWGEACADRDASGAAEGHRIARPHEVASMIAEKVTQVLQELDRTHYQEFRSGVAYEFMDAYLAAFERLREDYQITPGDDIYYSPA